MPLAIPLSLRTKAAVTTDSLTAVYTDALTRIGQEKGLIKSASVSEAGGNARSPIFSLLGGVAWKPISELLAEAKMVIFTGIPFEFEAVCSTLTHPVDVSFVFGVSIQKAAAGLVESIPVVTLLLTRTGNRMAFGAAENVKNLIPGAKLFLKFGTCCATATENIRRGDVAILGGSADSPCLYDVDENIEFSVVSPGYCHDLLLWQAAASSTLVDPRMRIHRLPLFSGSKQFLPGTFPKKIQPASGEMEAAGIWDSVSLTKNKELLFGSVNLISELFYMSEDQVEKFHDPKEKLGLLTSILPPVLKNLVIFLKNRSFFA